MNRLAYYESRFPFPQGTSAGPYSKFLGFYEPSFHSRKAPARGHIRGCWLALA